MKISITLLLPALVLFVGLVNAQNNSRQSIPMNDDSLKQFFGTIGDIPVEIFLKKHDNNIEGYLDYIYYYEFPDFLSQKRDEEVYKMPKQLYGNISHTGELRLNGFGNFKGTYTDGIITGTWTDFHKGTLRYPFRLVLKDILYNDWLTYRDQKHGIGFEYPPNAVITNSMDTNLKEAFLDIKIPTDSNTNLEERELKIYSVEADSCPFNTDLNNGSNEYDTIYSKQLGNNFFLIKIQTEGAMSHSYETRFYSAYNAERKRCTLIENFNKIVSLGPFDVPYREGYFNNDYKKGYYENNKYYEFNGPKPYNEKACQDLEEHLIGSIKIF